MLDSFDLGGIDKIATVLLLVVLGFLCVSTVAHVQTPDWTWWWIVSTTNPSSPYR